MTGWASVLLAAYFILFAVTLTSILRRDLFFAVFYCALFIYSFFSILGYAYFPILSTFLGLYFGEEVVIPALLFTMASMATVYLGFRLMYMRVVSGISIEVKRVRPLGVLVAPLYTVLFGVQLWFYLAYARNLDYATVSNDEITAAFGLGFKIAHLTFKFSNFYIVTLYALLALSVPMSVWQRITSATLLALHVTLFLGICLQLGTRTDPLKVTLGILFIEFMRRARVRPEAPNVWSSYLLTFVGKKTWTTAVAVGLGAGVLLSFLAKLRNPDAPLPDASTLIQSVLMQDYYAPYHMLLAAISLEIVDPVMVVTSNTANALAFLNVPYLQTHVMGYVAPAEVGSRSASPAFYLLSEGYLMAGPYGVFYNGLIVSAALSFWRLCTLTTHNKLNVLVAALFIEMAADAVRGQSSYFVKSFYLFVLPASAIFALVAGVLPARLVAGKRRLAT